MREVGDESVGEWCEREVEHGENFARTLAQALRNLDRTEKVKVMECSVEDWAQAA